MSQNLPNVCTWVELWWLWRPSFFSQSIQWGLVHCSFVIFFYSFYLFKCLYSVCNVDILSTEGASKLPVGYWPCCSLLGGLLSYLAVKTFFFAAYKAEQLNFSSPLAHTWHTGSACLVRLYFLRQATLTPWKKINCPPWKCPCLGQFDILVSGVAW